MLILKWCSVEHLDTAVRVKSCKIIARGVLFRNETAREGSPQHAGFTEDRAVTYWPYNAYQAPKLPYDRIRSVHPQENQLRLSPPLCLSG